MSEWWLVFAVLLYFFCAALLIAEIFIPSGGLISICSLLCLAGGLAIFFNYSTAMGIAGVIVAIVMIPTVVIIAYKRFPKSKFGKAVTLEPPKRPKGDAIPDAEQLEHLLDKSGTVITALRPVGTCDIDGHKVQCVAEGGFVDKGSNVKVINVQGTRVTVRVLEQD